MKSEKIILNCKYHGETEFRKSNRPDRKKEDSYYLKCIKCKSESARKRRIRNKKDFIDYKGGWCSICSKKYEWYQYDFHHINEGDKEFDVSRKATRKIDEEIKKELDKCILVCSSCHMKIHGGCSAIPEEYQSVKYKRCKDHNKNRCSKCHYSSKNGKEGRLLTLKLIEFSGKECQKCKEPSDTCLSFHHLEEDSKKFTIAHAVGKRMPVFIIIQEVEKCSLLCMNCHRDVHMKGSDDVELASIKLTNEQKEYLHNNFFGGKTRIREIQLKIKRKDNKSKEKKVAKKKVIRKTDVKKVSKKSDKKNKPKKKIIKTKIKKVHSCFMCNSLNLTRDAIYCSIKCKYLSGNRDQNLKPNKKNPEPIIFQIIDQHIKHRYNNSTTGRHFKVSDVAIYSRINKLSKLKHNTPNPTKILKDYIQSNFNRQSTMEAHDIQEEFYLFVTLAKAIKQIIKEKRKKEFYIENLKTTT